jgi:hypothetical protein
MFQAMTQSERLKRVAAEQVNYINRAKVRDSSEYTAIQKARASGNEIPTTVIGAGLQVDAKGVVKSVSTTVTIRGKGTNMDYDSWKDGSLVPYQPTLLPHCGRNLYFLHQSTVARHPPLLNKHCLRLIHQPVKCLERRSISRPLYSAECLVIMPSIRICPMIRAKRTTERLQPPFH